MVRQLQILGLLLLLALSSKGYAGVMYEFYGYDDCRLGGCNLLAKGSLLLSDLYVPGGDVSGHYQNWAFTNLVTGASYNLSNPQIAGYSLMQGHLPGAEGSASFFLDFIGDLTFFESDGSSQLWSHMHLEALNPLDPLQATLAALPIQGASHRWVRVEVSEPGILGLLGGGLLLLGLQRRRAVRA